MQAFTPEFARQHLVPQASDIEVGAFRYRAAIESWPPSVTERGENGESAYPIAYVLGGKNVYFFLTPWQGGRWQVLPVAFDVQRRQWYDVAASMVRHSVGTRDQALHWTERPFTFNTSCYGCHVSQLAKNYSLETDSYHTAWSEPGVNCQTCHGSGDRHIRAATAAGDAKLSDPQILRISQLDGSQVNSLCGPCHARMRPITAAFRPGEDYFDHYDLVTLEDSDFYPDGRDLGETFTYTGWRISPCAIDGRLDCLHCHTSSGRYKHAGQGTDRSCLPCHEQHVANPAAHSHHPAESPASRCVACHMPRTTFARMRRHDHSMLPPTPAATLAYGSPNACNLCHADRDAVWANHWVRTWYARDYQAPLLRRAELIDAARRGDWTKLPRMAAYLAAAERNEVFATSLIRLLAGCGSEQKWPALIEAAKDESPLVRSAAVLALGTCPERRARDVLIAATADRSRLVRINAAFALTRHAPGPVDDRTRSQINRAFAEFEASMRGAPDDPVAHYNLGVYHHNLGRLTQAVTAYETAARLDPANIPALVNVAMAHAAQGDVGRAEQALRRALEASPSDAAVNFNLGLLLLGKNQAGAAERCFRTALNSDPGFAAAAYELATLLADTRPDEAITFCRRAAELRPDDARYAFSLAWHLQRRGDRTEAAAVLRQLLELHPDHADARALLRAIGPEGTP